jgi:sugar (pentulose or hexulose) kinase
MLRAVLEGVAFSLRYLLDIYAEVGVDLHTIALAGGGAMLAGWPQLIADICRLPVHVYAAEETVTRALYAYACLALDPETSFEAALGRTFAAPEVYAVQVPDDTYRNLYRRYCRLVEFADQSLCT